MNARLLCLLEGLTQPFEARVPPDIQQQVVRLALDHLFTAHELARIVQTCYAITIGHRGIQRMLSVHQLTPDVLRLHHQVTQQTPLPPSPSGWPLDLALEPTTRAQRLLHALGPDHGLIRFRTYHEYPTAEQARWRIIELLEVGFHPRRVAKLLAIQPAVVYDWPRRFQAGGFRGLDHAKSCGGPDHHAHVRPGHDGRLPTAGQ